jgi:ubiquitin-protein ligase
MARVEKRIAKEYSKLLSDPVPGISVSLPNEANLLEWAVELVGAEGTLYEGERHGLRVTFDDQVREEQRWQCS